MLTICFVNMYRHAIEVTGKDLKIKRRFIQYEWMHSNFKKLLLLHRSINPNIQQKQRDQSTFENLVHKNKYFLRSYLEFLYAFLMFH